MKSPIKEYEIQNTENEKSPRENSEENRKFLRELFPKGNERSEKFLMGNEKSLLEMTK